MNTVITRSPATRPVVPQATRTDYVEFHYVESLRTYRGLAFGLLFSALFWAGVVAGVVFVVSF